MLENESFRIISNIQADKTATDASRNGEARSLNILLVEIINRQFQSINFPLQLFVLAGSISQRQPDGVVINRKHNVTIAQSDSSEGINSYIEEGFQMGRTFDVIGISAHHGNWECLTKTISSLRAIPDDQRPHVILGGYLPSYLHDQLLGGFADFPISIAVEHGDYSFRSYIERVSLLDTTDRVCYDIPGIINYKNRLLIPSKNTNDVYPWLDGVPLVNDDSNKVARIETSRGCFYNRCTFCSRPEFQKGWVKYSLDDVMRQMAELAEMGYRKFTFSDEEIIGNDPKRFTELMFRIREFRTEYADLGFFVNARVDNIVSANPNWQSYLDNMWNAAKKAGVVLVWVGAESYSPRQLTLYNKGKIISPQTNLDSIRKLSSAGLRTVQGFIPFHPLMDEEELGENLEFIERHAEEVIPAIDNPLGFLRVNPHTAYLEHVLNQQEEQQVRLIKEFDPNTLSYSCAYLNPRLGLLVSFLYSLKALTRSEIKHIQWDDDVVDGRLVRMRYINFDLLKSAYRFFKESTSTHSLETQLVTDLLPWYRKAIRGAGLNRVVEDSRDNFTDEFERNKLIFLN